MVRPERKPNVDKSKPCSKCAVTQPLENFRINRAAKDGRQSACKPCQRKVYEARAEHYKAKSILWKKQNPERSKLVGQIYREKNRDKFAERSRAWYSENKQRAHERRVRFYRENKKRAVEYTRQWRKDNPQMARANDKRHVHRRRLWKEASGHFKITSREIADLYSSPCVYCGSLTNIEMDHVVPLSRGGRHSIGNLVPACQSCNRSKSGYLITEWRKRKSPEA